MAILYITAIIFLFVIIAFTWYTLSELEPVEKIMYIAIGFMISLVVTVVLFNFSSKGIEYPVEEMFTKIRNITILAIMPINAILLLPYLGKQISKLKFDEITEDEFSKRIIVFAIILIAFAIFEVKYLTSIQLGILDIMSKMS